MRFKGLIFDKDGTLFHFQESWGDWLDEVLEILSGDSIEKKQKMAYLLGFNLSRKKFFQINKLSKSILKRKLKNLPNN